MRERWVIFVIYLRNNNSLKWISKYNEGWNICPKYIKKMIKKNELTRPEYSKENQDKLQK